MSSRPASYSDDAIREPSPSPAQMFDLRGMVLFANTDEERRLATRTVAANAHSLAECLQFLRYLGLVAS